MAREAIAKIEGAKFLKRDRALEEDEKSMARATSGGLSCTSSLSKTPGRCVLFGVFYVTEGWRSVQSVDAVMHNSKRSSREGDPYGAIEAFMR